jgi:hypothetical protein
MIDLDDWYLSMLRQVRLLVSECPPRTSPMGGDGESLAGLTPELGSPQMVANGRIGSGVCFNAIVDRESPDRKA